MILIKIPCLAGVEVDFVCFTSWWTGVTGVTSLTASFNGVLTGVFNPVFGGTKPDVGALIPLWPGGFNPVFTGESSAIVK